MKKFRLILLALVTMVSAGAWCATLGTVTMDKTYTIRCVWNNTSTTAYGTRYFTMNSATTLTTSTDIPNDGAGQWVVTGSATAAVITNVKYPEMKLVVSSNTFNVTSGTSEFNLNVNCKLDGANSLQQNGVMWGLVYSTGATGKFTGTTAYNIFKSNNLEYSTDFVFEEVGTYNIPQEGRAYFFVNYQQESSSVKTLTGNKYIIYAKSETVADVQTYDAENVPLSALFVARTVNASQNRIALRNINGNWLQRGNSNGVLTTTYNENYSSQTGNVLHVANVSTSSYVQTPFVSTTSYVELRGYRQNASSSDAPLIVNGVTPQLQTGTNATIIRSNGASDFYSTALKIVSAEDIGYTTYAVSFEGNGEHSVSVRYLYDAYDYNITNTDIMPYIILPTNMDEATLRTHVIPAEIGGFDAPTMTVDMTAKTIRVTYVQSKSEAYVALASAIATATATRDAATVGENPGYYTAASVAQLTTGIATAQAVLDNSGSDDAAYESAQSALEAITLETVQFADGRVYNIINHQKSGVEYKLYNNAGQLATSTDPATNQLADMFVCKKVGDKYVFISALTGDYLLYTGTNVTSPFNTTGFEAKYDGFGHGENGLQLTNHNELSIGYYVIGALRNRLTDANAGWATWYISSVGDMNANAGPNTPAYADAGSTYFSFNDVTANVHVYDVAFAGEERENGGLQCGDYAVTKGNHTECLYFPTLDDSPAVEAIAIPDYVGTAQIDGNTVTVTYSVPPTIKVTITEAIRGTYVSPFALDFTDSEIKASVCTGVNEKGQAVMEYVNKVAPNTGLYISAEAAGDYDVVVYDGADYDDDWNNVLKGNVSGGQITIYQTEDSYTNYILQKKATDAVPRFYRVATAGNVVNHGRAYLHILTPVASSKEVIDVEDLTTGIEEREEREVREVRGEFNLAGQRVGGDYKGIVIVNGKKILNK